MVLLYPIRGKMQEKLSIYQKQSTNCFALQSLCLRIEGQSGGTAVHNLADQQQLSVLLPLQAPDGSLQTVPAVQVVNAAPASAAVSAS